LSRKETLPPRGERVADRKRRIAAIVEELEEAYPNAKCALTYKTPFQLLVATVLSAQCTDERVNMVTPKLFKKWPTAERLADADVGDVEDVVRSTGFFRQKAKNIVRLSQVLVEEHDSVVPSTLNELTRLPGVARKTANVLISNCYPEHADGIAVDTHVQRIARRIGATRSWPTDQIERDLMKVLDKPTWNHITHLLIDHGRAVCTAISPKCGVCPIADLCPSRDRFLKRSVTARR
jgi:endonuclease-3